MLANILDKMAGLSPEYQELEEKVNEFDAVKAEIDKARCVVEFDAEGLILSANDNLLESLKYAEDDLLGQHHSILAGRILAAKTEYQEQWNKIYAGTTQTGNFRFIDKNGEVTIFIGYFAPIQNKSGGVVKVIAYLTDITNDANSGQDGKSQINAISKIMGVIEFDLKGYIQKVNDNFVAVTGYEEKDIVGNHHSMFVTTEHKNSQEYKDFWASLAKGEPNSGEYKRVGKDGKEIWLQASYNPILDIDGKPYKVVKYATDITRAKQEAANYAGQLNAISKIMGVIEFDLKGNIEAVNENFVKVTGYEENDIIGKHHGMFVESGYRESAEYKAFWDNLGRGEPNSGVYKRIGKDGKEIWLQASYNPIFDLNGNPFKVVKYATDITEVKQKEANDSGQIQALNKVLGVIEFDLKGNIISVNHNFTNFTGYSESEIVGQHHSMFASNEYKNSLEYKQFWADLAEGKPQAGQFQRFGKGGKEIWLEATYNPILDMDGKPFKIVKFASDITDTHSTNEMLEQVVEESKGVIQQAQQGNLTSRISMEGKTGAIANLCDGINALMDKMTEVLVTIREAGETINTAADEISTGNNDLSQRTEQQASNLEETASSMEELASTVKQNAENAKQANQLASAASSVAIKGGDVVGEVVTTMSAINESAQKIEDIITVIDGIAFQTNILALNAAVEAARAGEQGRGFAVVAGEVRNLAQRSASAAKEIKDLITDSVTKTAEGTTLVENAGTTMQEIVESVQRVTDIMGEISAASSEQSAGIDQVNGAITNMDEVTQQNAALVEEAAAAAESLVDQSISLMDTVNEFQLKGAPAKQDRRAQNSPMRAAKSTVAAEKKSLASKKPEAAQSVAKTGTDDDWEEF